MLLIKEGSLVNYIIFNFKNLDKKNVIKERDRENKEKICVKYKIFIVIIFF